MDTPADYNLMGDEREFLPALLLPKAMPHLYDVSTYDSFQKLLLSINLSSSVAK
jgi:hypothetical protein